MIRIVVPEASPSLNTVLSMHWAVRERAKKQWAWMIKIALAGPSAPKRATGKRRLTIERHGKRALDRDNLIGGAKKVVTDNLVQLGLLRDDSDAWVDFAGLNVPLAKGEKPHTVIVLEEI